MEQDIDEVLAQKTGFIYPHGNWITPDGNLVISQKRNLCHFDTLTDYLDIETDREKLLSWNNQKVSEGYIRLLFAHFPPSKKYVLFQVGFLDIDLIWSSQNACRKTLFIIDCLDPDTEVHIVSKEFYVLGSSKDILSKNTEALKVKMTKPENSIDTWGVSGRKIDGN